MAVFQRSSAVIWHCRSSTITIHHTFVHSGCRFTSTVPYKSSNDAVLRSAKLCMSLHQTLDPHQASSRLLADLTTALQNLFNDPNGGELIVSQLYREHKVPACMTLFQICFHASNRSSDWIPSLRFLVCGCLVGYKSATQRSGSQPYTDGLSVVFQKCVSGTRSLPSMSGSRKCDIVFLILVCRRDGCCRCERSPFFSLRILLLRISGGCLFQTCKCGDWMALRSWAM